MNEDDFSDMENRDSWQGLERFEARKRVIDEIIELGLLDKIEDISSNKKINSIDKTSDNKVIKFKKKKFFKKKFYKTKAK